MLAVNQGAKQLFLSLYGTRYVTTSSED